jgi:hypothetical protein
MKVGTLQEINGELLLHIAARGPFAGAVKTLTGVA